MDNKIRGKDTALVLILIFSLLYFFLHNNLFLVLSLFVTILALIVNSPFVYLSRYWFGFSHVLSLVVNKIILFIIFFAFLTPIGVFFKLFNKNSFNMKKNSPTLFKTRIYKYSVSDFKYPF